MAVKETQLMPKKYLSSRKTPLDATVEAGIKNTIDLEVSSK